MRALFASLVFGYFVFSTAFPALACSCPPPDTQLPLDALKEASVVFVGKVLRTEHFNDDAVIVEDATFQVSKGLKGVAFGDVVAMRSRIAPGACGKSATNDPMWLEDVQPDGTAAKVDIGRDWLVYAYGAAPFELSLCSRSLPLVIERANEDIRTLEGLFSKAR